MFGMKPRVEALERWQNSTKENDTAKAIIELKADVGKNFDKLMQITARIDKRTEGAYTFAEANSTEIKEIKKLLEEK